jgi:oligoribonuclease (3'-5' exoribonuclease)
VLQIALVATDTDLARLELPETDIRLFIKVQDPEAISPWVLDNIPHIVSGSRSDQAVDAVEADRLLCDYVDRIFGPASAQISLRPILAGNSVHNDWFMIRRYFPGLLSRAHYRLLDVSGFKTQWETWFRMPPFDKENTDLLKAYFPQLTLPEGAKEHDAYFDVQASIAELAYYRSRWAVRA